MMMYTVYIMEAFCFYGRVIYIEHILDHALRVNLRTIVEHMILSYSYGFKFI